MDIYNKVPSILTHGGTDKEAIEAAMGAQTTHYETQKKAMIDSGHMHANGPKDYPHHVYSTNPDTPMSYKEVANKQEHDAALATGQWADEVLGMVVVEDKGE